LKRNVAVVFLLIAVAISSLSVVTFAQTQTITIDDAVQLFKRYLTSLRNPDLAIDEVEEYQNNFYAAYYENRTGIFAFQLLIWKPGSPWTGGMMGNGMMSGLVMPEPGPNMMWNTKYGVMGGMMQIYHQPPTSNMAITREQAHTIAQQYAAKNFIGITAGDVDTFYGYYNVDLLENGRTFGMLSVNGYTSEVWYHSWHGAYVQSVQIRGANPVPEFPFTMVPLVVVVGLVFMSVAVKTWAKPRCKSH
jgi:hypothetical protein